MVIFRIPMNGVVFTLSLQCFEIYNLYCIDWATFEISVDLEFNRSLGKQNKIKSTL